MNNIIIFPPKPKVYVCAFCGKSSHEVLKMIGGAHHPAICILCVEECMELLQNSPDNLALRIFPSSEDTHL